MRPIAGSELDLYLARGRAAVEDALARTVPLPGSPPSSLHEAMRYTLMLPGKRLRGILVVACCELLKGRDVDAVPLAAAIELVHA